MSRSVATNSLIHLEREGETERESFVRKTERGRDRGGARERKTERERVLYERQRERGKDRDRFVRK